MGMPISYELVSTYFALSEQATELLWRKSECTGPVCVTGKMTHDLGLGLCVLSPKALYSPKFLTILMLTLNLCEMHWQTLLVLKGNGKQ